MPTMDDIQYEIKTLLDAFESGDATQVDELELDAYLNELASQEADKVDAYGYVLRQQAARVEFLKAEEQRISARRKTSENALERMKAHMLHVMLSNGLKKLSGQTATISVRASKSVRVDVAPEMLPESMRREKYIIEADKAAIKAVLESGTHIDGCYIIEGYSLQVK